MVGFQLQIRHPFPGYDQPQRLKNKIPEFLIIMSGIPGIDWNKNQSAAGLNILLQNLPDFKRFPLKFVIQHCYRLILHA